jgi:hypothetical protein
MVFEDPSGDAEAADRQRQQRPATSPQALLM